MKYYISATGLESNNGISEDTPWPFSKVNQTFQPGDIIALKCGDEFFGAFQTRNAAPTNRRKVTVGSYGVGAMPKVSQYKDIYASSWVQHAPNIWKVDINDVTKFGGYKDITFDGKNVGFLRVDGEIQGWKRFSVPSLAAQWEFFSDEVQWLYVYSTQNPSLMAGEGKSIEIRAAVGRRFIDHSTTNGGSGVQYCGLDLVGCAGHGCAGTIIRSALRGCLLHELGGGRLVGEGINPQTRYGNGVEAWNGSRDFLAEGNFIWKVYDVGMTAQGNNVTAATGWTNICYRQNFIAQCNQTFETWSQGVGGAMPEANSGFRNVTFVENVCLEAGTSWSSDIRGDQLTRAHLLIYEMFAPLSDIRVNRNKFYSAHSYLIARRGTAELLLPPGYNIDDNDIFLRPEQLLFSGATYTAAQLDEFVEHFGTGHNCRVEYLHSGDVLKVEDALARMTNAVTSAASGSNIHESAISMLYGRLAMLEGELANSSSDASMFPGFETLSISGVTDAYAKLLSIRLTNVNHRFDGVFRYMIGQDSVVNRNGTGEVSIHITPGAGLAYGTTGVDIDVFEVLPFRTGPTVADFKAVVTVEDGAQVVVEVYFNIGRDDFARLKTQPEMVMVGNVATTTYTFYDRQPLVSVLPSGFVFSGKTDDTSYQTMQPKTLVGSAAPTFAPTIVGQQYYNQTTGVLYLGQVVGNASTWKVPMAPRIGTGDPTGSGGSAPHFQGQLSMDVTTRTTYIGYGVAAPSDWGRLMSWAPAVPTAAGSTGAPGMMQADDTWLYIRGPNRWNKVPLQAI